MTLVVEVFNLPGAEDDLRRELKLSAGRGGEINETTRPRVWRLEVRLGWR